MTVKVMFEIDGEPVAADDASWYEFALCGCCCGAMSVVVGDDVYADEESVWKHLFPNATLRKRTREQGFTQKLGLRKDCAALLGAGAKCPHTPKYGVERTPKPEGHRWAQEDGRTRGRMKHLVQGEFDKQDRLWSYDPKVSALCGRESTAWAGGWHHVDGLPECTRCAKTAKKMPEQTPKPPAVVDVHLPAATEELSRG
jgi:hypothetical protein